MTREQFASLIKQKILVIDGATGTNLMKAGMPVGVCPETWILENPDAIRDLQTAYIDAGSNIILAPTFTSNRIKLSEYGLEKNIKEINMNLIKLSKEAVSRRGYRAYVGGDITMTGRQLYPMGTLTFEELVDVYKEQVGYMLEADIDLFVVETMMSLAETRAALIAIREMCDLPVITSMTFNEDGRTLYGTDPKTAVTVLQSLGADAVGINCSTGPMEMIPLLKEMREYATVPLMAKPNAGMPELINGETAYTMTPETFADYGMHLVEAGANIVGGCCGTNPKHIAALAQMVKSMTVPIPNEVAKRVVTSERMSVEIPLDGKFIVVGERINPTGKKKLQEELRAGKLDMVVDMAEEQEECGAGILDINMGTNGIDEKEMMLKAIYEVSNTVNLPLCIDSSYVEVVEAALRVYPGRALINSISLEQEKIEKLLPIAKKYGAMFILLPLSDAGLPKDKEEKIAIMHKILNKAYEAGFRKEDIIVDGLVATVGANKQAAIDTLDTIEYCKKELGIPTICGLSNISFGLPERLFVNTAFLIMAITKGLTMAIANPSQQLLMNAALATDLLLNKDDADVTYINNVKKLETVAASGNVKDGASKPAGKSNASIDTDGKSKVYVDVLKGNKRTIVDDTIKLYDTGLSAQNILDEHLIPAISQVGNLFNDKIYFLPQLISAAEAMELAINYLEPLMERKNQNQDMPTIIMATVEGDIHDIGKNLVVLMLKNYGYRVIDLGKDVPKEVIIDTAVKEKASIIGLSALMTTTMMKMKDVVDYAREKQVACKIIIGGAVITQSFADEIGADGYSKDAQEAVALVKNIFDNDSIN